MEPLKISVTSNVRFRAEGLPQGFVDDLKEVLIIKNPAYMKGLRYGRIERRFDVSPFLFCLWKDGENFIVTRGFSRRLFNLCHKHRIPFETEDRCISPPAVEITFNGSLYGYQADALRELEKRRFGILAGPQGCGKKVLALALVARRQSPALIVVTTRRQLYVWMGLIRRFLRPDEKEIGQIGDGQRRFGKITVAIIDSLYRIMDEAGTQAGFLIIDRADTVHMNLFRKAVLPFEGPYMLGLATHRERSDGLTDLMTAYLGDVVHDIKLPGKFAGLGSNRPVLMVRRTEFAYTFRDDYREMITALCRDKERNMLLVADILQETARPAVRALVLSDRIEHLKILKEAIAQARGRDAEIVTGETSEKGWSETIERFQKKPGLLLMTYRSSQAANIRGVDRLFLATPVKNGDYISQAVGAVFAGGEKSDEPGRVYDYRDVKISVLDSSFQKRRKLCASMGVLLEGTV